MRKLLLLTLFLPLFALANKTVYPAALHTGDTVALISSASHAHNAADIAKARNRLEALGLHVIDGKSIRLKDAYFAGPDNIRAQDINNMFSNPMIKAIFEVRGGWGSARLLDDIDFNIIEANPKIFMGFSDITSLLLAINKKTGLVTFHGPMGASYDWTKYTVSQIKNILFKKLAVTLENPKNKITHTITSGTATGEIIGGNLSVILSMVGTPYLPSFKGKILFIEDVGEDMYKVDRMLNQLKQMGALSELKGFIFGTCAHCTTKIPGSFTLAQLLDHYIAPLGIPSISGAMIGHQSDMLVIPEGAPVTLNATTGTIQLQRPAVSDNVLIV